MFLNSFNSTTLFSYVLEIVIPIAVESPNIAINSTYLIPCITDKSILHLPFFLDLIKCVLKIIQSFLCDVSGHIFKMGF